MYLIGCPRGRGIAASTYARILLAHRRKTRRSACPFARGLASEMCVYDAIGVRDSVNCSTMFVLLHNMRNACRQPLRHIGMCRKSIQGVGRAGEQRTTSPDRPPHEIVVRWCIHNYAVVNGRAIMSIRFIIDPPDYKWLYLFTSQSEDIVK